jgi:hypothetical protein
LEQLQALLKQDPASDTQLGRGSEAGHSAVILSRERYSPSQGILLDDPS